MLQSNSRASGVQPTAANDNRAPETWDEALATDLAILDPVADRFGWSCTANAPGSYQVGPYYVEWREGTYDPFWDLGCMVPDFDPVEPVFFASGYSLELIATVIGWKETGVLMSWRELLV